MSKKKQTKKTEPEQVPGHNAEAKYSYRDPFKITWSMAEPVIVEANGRKHPKLVLPGLTQCVHCGTFLSTVAVSRLHAYRCAKHPTSIALEAALASDAKLIEVVTDGWEIQAGKFMPKGESKIEVAQ